MFPAAFKVCPLLFWQSTLNLSAGRRTSPCDRNIVLPARTDAGRGNTTSGARGGAAAMLSNVVPSSDCRNQHDKLPPVWNAALVEPRVRTIGDQITWPVFELLNTPLEPPTLLTATDPDAAALSSVVIKVSGTVDKPLFDVPGCHKKGVAATAGSEAQNAPRKARDRSMVNSPRSCH